MLARGHVKIELIEGADHTFTDLTARATLATALSRILGVGASQSQPGCEAGR